MSVTMNNILATFGLGINILEYSAVFAIRQSIEKVAEIIEIIDNLPSTSIREIIRDREVNTSKIGINCVDIDLCYDYLREEVTEESFKVFFKEVLIANKFGNSFNEEDYDYNRYLKSYMEQLKLVAHNFSEHKTGMEYFLSFINKISTNIVSSYNDKVVKLKDEFTGMI